MTQFQENILIGTVLILLVALLRRLLRGYIPAKTWIALWGICLFRLLSPAVPKSALSICNLYQKSAADSSSMVVNVSNPVGIDNMKSTPVTIETARQAAEAISRSSGAGISITQILMAIYLLGAICAMLYFLYSWIRTCHMTHTARLLERSDARYLGLPKKIRLREGQVEGAPFTFGIFHPTIVLPPGLSDTESSFVLMHEGIHAQHMHNLWYLIMAAVLVIYWWNPAVWLMSYLLRQDLEMACDQVVLARIVDDRRKEYANTLVSMSVSSRSYAFSQSFGSKNFQERIVSIMRFRKITIPAIALSFILVFGACAGFATGAVGTGNSKDSNTKEPTAQTTKDKSSSVGQKTITIVFTNLVNGDEVLSEDKGPKVGDRMCVNTRSAKLINTADGTEYTSEQISLEGEKLICTFESVDDSINFDDIEVVPPVVYVEDRLDKEIKIPLNGDSGLTVRKTSGFDEFGGIKIEFTSNDVSHLPYYNMVIVSDGEVYDMGFCYYYDNETGDFTYGELTSISLTKDKLREDAYIKASALLTRYVPTDFSIEE